jgi:hypothetical protein
MSEQQTPPHIPCRLFGLLARDVPRAVILRRGPTRLVQQILWHTDTDTFEEGQWFYGRIYEWGSDLSPDGSLFLYLARKAETQERKQSRTTHKWTALSQPPYFTALSLWPAGDTWQGGGMFLSNHALWLCYDRSEIKERHYKHLAIEASFKPERMLEQSVRDGWQLVQRGQFGFEGLRGITHQPTIWQKHRPDQRYCLVKEFYRAPNFRIESLIYLVDTATGTQQLLEETTWINWDHRGRLVFARSGKLFASLPLADHPLQVEEIADFNSNTPTSVIAPYRGIKW